jgi:hypothetical protein
MGTKRPVDMEAAARLVRLLDTLQRDLCERYDEVPAAWLPRRECVRRAPSVAMVTGGEAPATP